MPPALLIAQAPPAPPASQQRPVSAWDVHPRALVVDPAGAVGMVLAFWLRAHGYTVDVEESLTGALEHCRRNPPHLLVSYRSIRGGTAQQLYREIRSDPLLYNIPAIFVTSLDDSNDVREALAAGANAYHHIPFDIDLLYEQIRSLLAYTQGWLLPPSAEDSRAAGYA